MSVKHESEKKNYYKRATFFPTQSAFSILLNKFKVNKEIHLKKKTDEEKLYNESITKTKDLQIAIHYRFIVLNKQFEAVSKTL